MAEQSSGGSLKQHHLRGNTVDAVANQLRSELLLGGIQPRARIMPAELGRRYSVSHIPVREALRRLEAEGLVVTSPAGGTYAAAVGLEDLRALYELRRVVEGEFVARAALVRSDAAVATVEGLLADLASAPPYSEEFFVAHRAFHWELLAPAAGDLTRRVLEGLWQAVDRYVALAANALGGFATDQHVDATAAEHEALAAGFKEGNAEALRSRLIGHLIRTEDHLRGCYGRALEGDEIPWLERERTN